MERVHADTFIECNVNCPYCDSYQDKFSDLHEYFENGEPRATDIEAEITCDDCKKTFIVEQINY